MKVTFFPQNITINNLKEDTIINVASKAGIVLNGECSGRGTCGKCKVKTIDASPQVVNDPNKLLTNKEIKEGYKLACLQQISDEMTIISSPNSINLYNLESVIIFPQWFSVIKTISAKKGISIDIGTTSLVVMLWNLGNGNLIDLISCENPQCAYGADVISRITYINENKDGLITLQKLIVNKINEIINIFYYKGLFEKNEIKSVVAVGNTVMSYIFLGYNPKNLVMAPFEMVNNKKRKVMARDLGLLFMSDCYIEMLPNLGGHVGSDITAGLLTLSNEEKERVVLYIDIGTNGEIALISSGKIYSCATAAGPAFEGGSITCGMRAINGAIESINITEENLNLKVIGNKEPLGICGSGIIDAIAKFYELGLIDRSGAIIDKKVLISKRINLDFIRKVDETSKEKSIILSSDSTNKKNIKITQSDIRKVQLSKAAINAGIFVLLEAAGISIEDVDEVKVAGVFGSKINIKSAITIGLFPNMSIDRFSLVGNAAAIGASMALFSEDIKNEANIISQNIKYIELSTDELFNDKYIKRINF